MSAISDMVRTEFKKGDDIRDAGLGTPEDIVRFNDIVYGNNPDWQMLDVYRCLLYTSPSPRDCS